MELPYGWTEKKLTNGTIVYFNDKNELHETLPTLQAQINELQNRITKISLKTWESEWQWVSFAARKKNGCDIIFFHEKETLPTGFSCLARMHEKDRVQDITNAICQITWNKSSVTIAPDDDGDIVNLPSSELMNGCFLQIILRF